MKNARMRQLLIALGSLLVVALVGVGIAAALRAPSPGGAQPTGSPAPSSVSSTTPAPEDEDSADEGSDDGEPGDATSKDDEFYGDTVTDSAEGEEAAEFENGLGVRLVEVEQVTLDGEGIGSTSGPGVEVTIELTNKTGKKASLGAVVVNAYTGKERTPATPVEGATGFEGSIAKGAKKLGTYSFGVPKAGATLYLAVSTSADSGVVVLEYR